MNSISTAQPGALPAARAVADAGVDPATTTLARGVSSAARLRARPLVLSSAHAQHVVDRHGTTYTDYVLGMGPMLLGHAQPHVLRRVRERMDSGTLFGTTEREFALADELCRVLPHAETVSFVNSGSEATHQALRIARVGTGRRLVLKFEGHYHGWLDPLFANTQNNASAPRSEFPVAGRHSVAGQQADPDVLVIRWNDLGELRRTFAEHAGRIAAVILEPVPMNFGTLRPDPSWLAELRDLTHRDGAVLVFDEVLSGFRLALGGAAELLGVRPDIAVYAKAIANGFPLAAVVGTRAAMEPIVSGPMLPAGTYSGNAVSVEAGLATLELLMAGGAPLYAGLDRLGSRLAGHLQDLASETGAPLVVNQVGSVLQLFWGLPGPVRNYTDADASDREVVRRITEGQLERGAVLSGRGLILLSTEHTDSDVDRLAEGLRAAVLETL